MSPSALTLAEQAYIKIKKKIITAEINPGTQLRLLSLKEKLDIGYTPLREALMRLSSEGFVSTQGQRGFRVAPISLKEFKAITQDRIAIEALNLRAAISTGDENWEAKIVGNFHRLSKRNPIDPDTGLVSAEWDEAHKTFHQSLIEANESRWLKHFWEILFDQACRYRQIAVTYGYVFRNDLMEHQVLLDHVLDRNVEKVLESSAEHINGTYQVVTRILEENLLKLEAPYH